MTVLAVSNEGKGEYDMSDGDRTDSIDIEKGEDGGEFKRTDTVRFGGNAHGDDGDEATNKRVMASAGIGLPRTLSLERPRFEQKNKVIGDFRTLSIQLSQGGLAADTQRIKRGKKDELKDIADLDWHNLSTDETVTRLSTSPHSGLDSDQAKSRLDRDGPNTMSKPPNRWLKKLFTYVFGGFGSLLTGGSVICFVAWRIGQPMQASNIALAIVLLVVVIVTALFNAWQDFTTSRVMESVRGLLPSDVPVLRNGTIVVVPAASIVRGDVISCKMGSKLPADCRVLSIASELKLDRSTLTGESDAIVTTIEQTDENYLESRNVLLAGTKCVSGDATAVVTATGDSTVFARLAKLSSVPKSERTTLEKEIFIFVLTIASLAASIAIICVIIWAAYLRPKHPDFMSVSSLLVNVVSILVAFIPEGLPAAVTLSLTVVAARMRKAKVLVKSLSIVETLGAVNVVCSDKTGTLTQNKMTVKSCAVFGFEDDDVEEVQRHISLMAPIGQAFSQLAWLAAVCNAATFDEATEGLPLDKQNIFGDATDTACLRFSRQVLGDVETNGEEWNTVQSLSFNSKNKFALRLVENIDAKGITHALSSHSTFRAEEELLLLAKGAPDVLMPRCTHTLDASGRDVPLTDDRLHYLTSLQGQWASRGQRVLLLARKVIGREALGGTASLLEHQFISHLDGLTVVGLVGIVDPPRPEIPGVVKTVRGAGSRFFMVTGDFSATAVAIARQCGIVTTNTIMTFDDIKAGLELPRYWFLDDNDARPQRALSLSGQDIQRLQPADWEQVCNFDEIVFSRTTPDQKLRIVKEFQQRSGVVAMTGDGVNDAPALKQADCGIAMGGGSEVAIEAADLVLLDSFESFIDALLYGRLCFDNLKKTVAYLLPAGSFAELWAILLSFFFGLPQALSNIQMILVCVLTDLFPALSLIQEKPESDVLLRKPRNTKTDRLANALLLLHAYLFVGVPLTVTSCAMSFWWMERRGIAFDDMWLKYGSGLVQTTRPDYFAEIVNEANAIYFFNLVICQFFNVHALRTRRLSLFQHWPHCLGKTRNLYILPAIALSFLFAIFFSYIPPIQNVFLTRSIPVEYFFLPMAFGLVTLSMDEVRKLAVRSYPKSLLAKAAW